MMSGFGGGAASAGLPVHPHPHAPHQQRPPTQQQQEIGTDTPGRQTYKSCDFCAKRKRKCDGKLPRCSLCVEKNQAHCHYQLKPPKKTRAGRPAVARKRPPSTPVSASASASASASTCIPSSYKECSSSSSSSSPSCSSSSASSGGVGGAKRLAGQPPVACGGAALVLSGTTVVAMEPGLMSLKRCRLSASPATGMVGMQENVFLGDFFGCMGILPLATESIVRDAMVEIMMGAMTPRQRQQQLQFSLAEHELERDRHHLAGGGGDAFGAAGERPGFGFGCKGGGGDCESEGLEASSGWGRGLMGHASNENPGRCIMWCAIALGALVKGAPIEYVAGYVSLAREALATCFDGSSIENVRAYLMMSFLHGLINDEEKKEKYLSFAMSIASKLRQGEVPKELGNMILSTEKMKLFTKVDDEDKDVLGAYCEALVELPSVGEVVEQKDLCNLFLVADRRLSQAFITDMMSQGALGAADDAGGLDGRRESLLGEFLGEQQVGQGPVTGRGPRARVEEVVETRLPAPKDPGVCCDQPVPREPPCAGAAVRGYIQEVLPELARLAKALGRSNSTAGIGGVLYHGNVAYMQAVEGEMTNSFESLRACADVVLKYPGIVRFRPHLVHCILAASHAWDRGLYDTIRRVYNSVGHAGCRAAPPFEEWGGMRQLCEHIFCRSVAREVKTIHDLKRRVEHADDGSDEGHTTGSSSSLPSSPPSSSAPPPCSPYDLDLAVSSWTGVKAGSEAGVHSSGSNGGGGGGGPVLAEPVLTRPMLAEAEVVVSTGPPHFQHQHQQAEPQAPVSRGLAAPAPDTYQRTNLGNPVAMTARAPAAAHPAMTAAAAASVATGGQEQEQEFGPFSRGVAAAPAGANVPELPSASMGRGSGVSVEDVGMTDADLFDIEAVLMSEDGPLDELL